MIILVYYTKVVSFSMNLSRADIQKLLRYEFLLSANAPTAAKRINKAHGSKSVSRMTANRWFLKFKP